MPKKDQSAITAEQVDKAVRQFYSRAGMVTLSQVRNGTGYARSVRTADMLAISTWPSRGLYASGIEIKVSKYDLRKELENPQKADDIAKYCRYWYLAVPKGLTDDEPIPPNWGVLEASEVKGHLIVNQTVAAGTLTELRMDDLFVCSVLRNFSECHVHRDEIEDRIKSESEARLKRVTADNEYDIRKARELLLSVERWEGDHGLKLTDYSGKNLGYEAKRVGQAVSLILNLRTHPLEQLKDAADAVAAAHAALASIFNGKEEIA